MTGTESSKRNEELSIWGRSAKQGREGSRSNDAYPHFAKCHDTSVTLTNYKDRLKDAIGYDIDEIELGNTHTVTLEETNSDDIPIVPRPVKPIRVPSGSIGEQAEIKITDIQNEFAVARVVSTLSESPIETTESKTDIEQTPCPQPATGEIEEGDSSDIGGRLIQYETEEVRVSDAFKQNAREQYNHQCVLTEITVVFSL